MKRKPNTAIAVTQLRQRAATRLRTQRNGRRTGAGDRKSAADTQRLLHELQVHQIELEMQNEELQKARDEMEAGLEKYSDLYDFAPVGYFTLTADGTIHLVNLTGASLVGIERSRLVGQSFGRLIAAELRPAFDSLLKEVFARQAKQESDFELFRLGKPSRFVNLKAQCSPNGRECRVVVADITEHKQAEAATAQLAAIVKSSRDAIVSKDLNGIVTSWNAGAERIFGYSASEMVGRPITQLVPSDRLREEVLIMSRIRKGESVEHFETLRVAKDGRVLDVSVTVSPIRLATGQIVGASKIARDITERKQAVASQRRLEVLAASNRKLEQEIVQRQAVEISLKESERHQSRLLKQSRQMQEQLQNLSRQVLGAQEEERKRISRELHDVIAQTLTGINIQLAALNKGAGFSTKDFDRNVTHVQQLVGKSVTLVQEFARELRPAVLDDLGLIPALHSFMKSFAVRTGLHTRLTAFAGVEQFDTAQRTVLYRVAQEALTNVARHAQASRVEVVIEKLPDSIRMKIIDNGKSFEMERVLNAKVRGRLGLLGMRERLEMVGGRFEIKTAPGKGTTVLAQIPSGKAGGTLTAPVATKP